MRLTLCFEALLFPQIIIVIWIFERRDLGCIKFGKGRFFLEPWSRQTCYRLASCYKMNVSTLYTPTYDLATCGPMRAWEHLAKSPSM